MSKGFLYIFNNLQKKLGNLWLIYNKVEDDAEKS